MASTMNKVYSTVEQFMSPADIFDEEAALPLLEHKPVPRAEERYVSASFSVSRRYDSLRDIRCLTTCAESSRVAEEL